MKTLWELFEEEDSVFKKMKSIVELRNGNEGDVHRDRANDRGAGSESDWLGYGDRDSDRESATDYWAAPSFPGRGMTAKELAEYQKAFTRHARGRILGVGAEQYADEAGQKFEGYSVNRLISEMQDEMADVVNYAAMISIQLERIKEKYVQQG